MPLGSFDRMVLVFSTGLGLALLGCLNTFLRRSPSRIRVPLSLAIVGGSSVLAWGISGLNQVAMLTGCLLGGLWAVQILAGSDWLAKAVLSVAAKFRSPVIRWGSVGVLGLASAIASVLYEEHEFAQTVDQSMAELESLTALPPSDMLSTRAMTDAGHDITLREAIAPRSEREMSNLEELLFARPGLREIVIRRAPGSDSSNCHGWVFTGARFWITGTEVDRIIDENGYQVVTDPHAGDLVVYRSGTGTVLHSAVVRYVSDGLPVLVEGKWGASGVYLHPVDKSIYGTTYQYYRSSRTGHVLAGLPNSETNRASFAVPSSTDRADPDDSTE